MSVNFTPAQRAAVNSSGATLVSAAAGSGKTAVLVERVISKIAPKDEKLTPPIPADRLLIVTFTNAAAAEMRGRIERALYEKIKENPQKEYLKRQKHLLGIADISTIDSFCAKLVRENFSYFGISPDFSVSDGGELFEKRKVMLDNILKPYFEENSAAFNMALSLTGCEYDEKNLCDLVEDIFEKAMLRPFPNKYYDNLLAPYKEGFKAGHAWYEGVMEEARNSISLCNSDALALLQNAKCVGVNSEKYIVYAETLIGVIGALKSAAETGYTPLHEALSIASLANLPRAKVKDRYTEEIKALKERIKVRLDNLKELFLYDISEIEALKDRAKSAVELITEICRQYEKGYLKLCLEENILTFAFCEQLTFRLLCSCNGDDPENGIAKSIIEKYDEVMVDEYQDVNDLQDAIFTAISNNGKNLFSVGDVKQSIYGFRGSNPENFIKKETGADTAHINKIFLSENFRSSSGVCNCVNYLFSLLLNGQVGDIIYGEDERLRAAAKFPKTDTKASELLLVDTSDKSAARLDLEAEAIADYIEKTVNEGQIIKVDENTARPAKYSDFTILLRSVSNKAQTIAEALAKRQIPVSFNSESFFDTFEIRLIISLLKVINNPKSDVELLTVMLSPLFDFNADELANIRIEKRRESLYSSVIRAAENGNTKCQEFLKTLDNYRRLFVTNTLGEAVNRLYSATDICDLVSLMPGGESKLSNLLLFSKLALDYSERSSGGIYGFLRYAENLPERAFKTGEAAQSGVKIMSMHKSKGLQFPICILANLSGKTNKSDSTERILKDEKLGIGFYYFDEDKGEMIKTVNHKLLAYAANKKTVEEELRLLYVAATRAQDKVCFVCSLDNPASRLKTLSQRVSLEGPYINAESLLNGVSMSDFVLYCLLLNKGAEELCKTYEITPPTVHSDFVFNTDIYHINAKDANAEDKAQKETGELDQASLQKLLDNFNFEYPYKALSGIEAKVSVSRLANGEEAERFAFTAKPSFMIEGGLSAADAGSAMHHAMQYISFDENVDVEGEINRLTEWRFISEAEAKALDVYAIKRFFESDIFKSIKQSPDIRREMRFLTEVPVKDIEKQVTEIPDDTCVLVQGAVDLCYRENDSVTVLDFKTDRVESLDVLKDRYSEQLSIYSKACEKIFNLPVKKRVIYSFYLSDFIEF